MTNINVFRYVQHSCWDPIPSEWKGHLCILTQIYHIVLFSHTFLKSEVALKNSGPGGPLAAARRTGCVDTPRCLHGTEQRSLETSGMVGSWKASCVAAECGEKDDDETKEREGVCKLSWLVWGILRGFLF